MRAWIGTSGWSYDHWQGILYPEPTPVAKRLGYYVERFDTVELNSSFYHWPRSTTFTGWRERLPQAFHLSLKAPGILTHRKRLAEPEEWVQRIVADVKRLEETLGVLLLQLSPAMKRDLERLDLMLVLLPLWLRVAVEFRHPSWNVEETFQLLERRSAAYCVMSGAKLPCILRATAPFVYVRLHGPDTQHLYGGYYSDEDLGWWAARIQEWLAGGRDVFAYFNNDGGGAAVYNALALRERLGAAALLDHSHP